MCTITLQYDSKNALARRKLSDLMASGLFTPKNVYESYEDEDVAEHRQEIDQMMAQSRQSMAPIVARYV